MALPSSIRGLLWKWAIASCRELGKISFACGRRADATDQGFEARYESRQGGSRDFAVLQIVAR